MQLRRLNQHLFGVEVDRGFSASGAGRGAVVSKVGTPAPASLGHKRCLAFGTTATACQSTRNFQRRHEPLLLPSERDSDIAGVDSWLRLNLICRHDLSPCYQCAPTWDTTGRGNMGKGEQSGSATVSALRAFSKWLEEETPNGKIRQVLGAFADQTLHALERGDAPPIAEVVQLWSLHRERWGGAASDEPITGKWLPSSQVQLWWSTRENSRRQFLQAAGCELDVELRIQRGGGRGNSTTYQFEFVDSIPIATQLPIDIELEDKSRLVYRHEPAKANWLFGFLLDRPFVTRSWKGLAVMLMLAIPFFATIACAVIVAIAMALRSGAHAGLAFWCAEVGILSALVTWTFRSLWQLPDRRVTIAPAGILALRQLDAQFRLSPDEERKTRGRFSLVRFHSTCPICAGTIEVRDGGRSYPGRLVGCCSENPREHVYSFDAVTLTGRLLIER